MATITETMSSKKGVLAAWLGVVALITYQSFKNPDPNWPLGPVPPPFRYTWSAVVFGILLLVADFINPKIANVIAGGVLIGVFYMQFNGSGILGGKPSGAPSLGSSGSSPTKNTKPAAPNSPSSGNPQKGGTNSPNNPSTSKRFPNG